MNKKLMVPFTALSALTFVLQPITAHASIQTSKNQIASSNNEINKIEAQINEVRQQKSQTQSELAAIEAKMSAFETEIQKLTEQILQIDDKKIQAEKELLKAEERVKKRETILDGRLAAMYEQGEVSYMEILLGSESMGDFLGRLDAIQIIIEQDLQLLEDDKKDRDIISRNKQEIEIQLAKLKIMEAEKSFWVESLENEKKPLIEKVNQLQVKEDELEEVKEEQQQYALHLVNQLQGQGERPSMQYAGGRFILPVPGARISSHFGYRVHPILHTRKFHDGTDFAAPQGTAIGAAASGTVVFTGYMNGYGNTVILSHGEGLSTLYAHIRDGGIQVVKGQQVQAGEKIAEVGSTGRSTGPHLHLTVIRNGEKLNPLGFF